MRGTNYTVGFGIALFFFLGGAAMYRLGQSEWPFEDVGGELAGDAAGDTFRSIGAIWFGVGGLLLLLFVLLAVNAARKRAIVRSGRDGVAVVLAADTTNTQINGMPQYRLELDVRPLDGGPGSRCVRRDIVPYTSLGRWGVGTELPVRIDADDPDRFEILWDQLPVPGAEQRRPSVADDLTRLADLAQKGLLSPEEWERAKELYLGKPADRRGTDARLLDELHDLFREGALSESEFNAKKWEILART